MSPNDNALLSQIAINSNLMSLKTAEEYEHPKVHSGCACDVCEQKRFAFYRAIQADALRHAADLCAKVSPKCGELKDKAIRDCIKVIYDAADKLTTP